MTTFVPHERPQGETPPSSGANVAEDMSAFLSDQADGFTPGHCCAEVQRDLHACEAQLTADTCLVVAGVRNAFGWVVMSFGPCPSAKFF